MLFTFGPLLVFAGHGHIFTICIVFLFWPRILWNIFYNYQLLWQQPTNTVNHPNWQASLKELCSPFSICRRFCRKKLSHIFLFIFLISIASWESPIFVVVENISILKVVVLTLHHPHLSKQTYMWCVNLHIVYIYGGSCSCLLQRGVVGLLRENVTFTF